MPPPWACAALIVTRFSYFYHCVLLKSEEPRFNLSYVDPHSGGEDGAYERGRIGLSLSVLLLCSTQTRALALAMRYLVRHNSVTRSALLSTNLSAHRSRKIILKTRLLFGLSFLDPNTGCFPPVFCFGPDSFPGCVKMTLGGGVFHNGQRCWVLVAWSTPTSILVAEQWLSTNTSPNP